MTERGAINFSESIAGIAIYPWYGALVEERLYDADKFLVEDECPYVQWWAITTAARPAVRHGQGEPSEQLYERHDVSDFDTRTQDKM